MTPAADSPTLPFHRVAAVALLTGLSAWILGGGMALAARSLYPDVPWLPDVFSKALWIVLWEAGRWAVLAGLLVLSAETLGAWSARRRSLVVVPLAIPLVLGANLAGQWGWDLYATGSAQTAWLRAGDLAMTLLWRNPDGFGLYWYPCLAWFLVLGIAGRLRPWSALLGGALAAIGITVQAIRFDMFGQGAWGLWFLYEGAALATLAAAVAWGASSLMARRTAQALPDSEP